MSRKKHGELSTSAKIACGVGAVSWFGGASIMMALGPHSLIDPMLFFIGGGIVALACFVYVMEDIFS